MESTLKRYFRGHDRPDFFVELMDGEMVENGCFGRCVIPKPSVLMLNTKYQALNTLILGND